MNQKAITENYTMVNVSALLDEGREFDPHGMHKFSILLLFLFFIYFFSI